MAHEQIMEAPSTSQSANHTLHRKPKLKKIQQLSAEATIPKKMRKPAELTNFSLDASDDDDSDWESEWEFWESDIRAEPCSTPMNGPDAGCTPERTLVLPPPATSYKDYGILGRRMLKIEGSMLNIPDEVPLMEGQEENYEFLMWHQCGGLHGAQQKCRGLSNAKRKKRLR